MPKEEEFRSVRLESFSTGPAGLPLNSAAAASEDEKLTGNYQAKEAVVNHVGKASKSSANLGLGQTSNARLVSASSLAQVNALIETPLIPNPLSEYRKAIVVGNMESKTLKNVYKAYCNAGGISDTLEQLGILQLAVHCVELFDQRNRSLVGHNFCTLHSVENLPRFAF